MKAEICALTPSNWQIRSVEDICTRVTSGGTPSRTRPDFYVNGVWPWVKTQELQDTWIEKAEEKITEEAVANSSAKVLPPNTILLAMYGATVGQLGILRSPMTCNQACCAMIVDSEKADFRYLYHHLRYSRTQLKSLATGAAQQNLNGALIKSLLYPFPPLAEQKAIAAVLEALDDKIELNRRMNVTLEAMARALFQSWFVDFDPVRAKLDGRKPVGMDEATAALFPDHLEDSPIGHLPTGWKVGKIQDCCVQIQNGGTPRRNEPRFWDGGNIPWLASGEVRQSIITATESFITVEGLAESSAKWVPAFSTVVALYGATAGQVSFTSSRLTTNQAVCALIPKKDFAFFNYLTMREATVELENKAVGSAQQNISKGIVEETRVVLPPSALIERFATVASPLFERWISNLHQSRTLATLRDTLLPKLLSGELSSNHLQN
jgi:type I restriction enzyme S subunit